MKHNSNQTARGECSSENRRTLLKGIGALAAISAVSTASLAQEALEISFRESDLGIDYRAIAPSPLAEMLSQGEIEFFQNATSVFGDETIEAWKEFSAQIATGSISEYHVQDLREFTPNILRNFSKLDHRDEKYGGLSAAGSAYIASTLVAEL